MTSTSWFVSRPLKSGSKHCAWHQDGVSGTIGLAGPAAPVTSASRRAPGNAPGAAFGLRACQVQLDRAARSSARRVLQPPLDHERGLVVEDAVPDRVLLEDDLPGDDEHLRVPLHQADRELLGLDRDLGADGVGAGRRQPERGREAFVLREVLARALLERGDLAPRP